MEEFLMQRATEGVIVVAEKSDREYRGRQLIRLLRKAREYTNVYGKLNRRIQDKRVLDRLLEFVADEGGLFSNGNTYGIGPGSGADWIWIQNAAR